MRKHVDDPGGLEHKAVLMDQHAEIAGETAGMAGDVQHAPRAQGRRTTYRQTTTADGRPYPPAARTGTYMRDEVSYDDDYPR